MTSREWTIFGNFPGAFFSCMTNRLPPQQHQMR